MRNRVAALVAALLMGAAALAGCTKPGTGTDSDSGSGTLGDAVNATTPAPNGGPTTVVAPPPTYPNDIVEYAKAAVTAWASKDETRLDQLEAAGGILHELLDDCPDCYNTNFYLSTCPQTGPYVTCTFFNAVGDELRLRGDPSLIGKPHAIPAAGSVFDQITFPSDNKAYASLAMTAWLNRNDNRLKLLTKDSLTSAQVDALGGNRNAAWNYDHSEGAAGSIYYVWKDPSGHTMSVRFVNGPAAPTTGPGAQHRIVQFIYLP
jgi:predicted small secreted protein